ncbi:MAG TPA: hypothetical protein DDW52_24880 [Planctomycetaceae bacterium]|nr:hypothetical protein [Planctomycetaceae bacterium]
MRVRVFRFGSQPENSAAELVQPANIANSERGGAVPRTATEKRRETAIFGLTLRRWQSFLQAGWSHLQNVQSLAAPARLISDST